MARCENGMVVIHVRQEVAGLVYLQRRVTPAARP
jgi:hypothetical protein